MPALRRGTEMVPAEWIDTVTHAGWRVRQATSQSTLSALSHGKEQYQDDRPLALHTLLQDLAQDSARLLGSVLGLLPSVVQSHGGHSVHRAMIFLSESDHKEECTYRGRATAAKYALRTVRLMISPLILPLILLATSGPSDVGISFLELSLTPHVYISIIVPLVKSERQKADN